MKIKSLDYGAAELYDVDICNLTNEDYYQIREALTTYLTIVIKRQPILIVPFAKICHKLGKTGIAGFWQAQWLKDGTRLGQDMNRNINPTKYTGPDELFPVQRVTGQRKNGMIAGIFGTGKLDWHNNINGWNRADGVALQGVSPGIVGTSTSFMNTTMAYKDMSDELKKRCEGIVGRYECAVEVWAEGMPDAQFKTIKENNSLPYLMPLLTKTSKGQTGMFFHFLNNCKFPKDPELLDILKEHCLQQKYIYTHWWEPGDIVISDQKHTLHKRDQDGDDMLQERVLHRYIFYINETDPIID